MFDTYKKFVNSSGKLFLRNGRSGEANATEVSVVYFRAGYTPNDYPSELEWTARAIIESAWRCIKGPTLAYQLAGSKIVQQRLCETGQVEAFLHDIDDMQQVSRAGVKREAGEDSGASTVSGAAMVRSCFTELYSLSRKSATESFSLQVGNAVLNAVSRPSAWVLKPQREGGGNNLYGEEVRNALWGNDNEKLGSLVLMSRIFPRPQPAILVLNERPELANTVSELGIYGSFLAVTEELKPKKQVQASSKKKSKKKSNSTDHSEELQQETVCGNNVSRTHSVILINEYAGHLLRTKKVSVDEGGVASGYAVLSSPLLV